MVQPPFSNFVKFILCPYDLCGLTRDSKFPMKKVLFMRQINFIINYDIFLNKNLKKKNLLKKCFKKLS